MMKFRLLIDFCPPNESFRALTDRVDFGEDRRSLLRVPHRDFCSPILRGTVPDLFLLSSFPPTSGSIRHRRGHRSFSGSSSSSIPVTSIFEGCDKEGG